MKEIVIYDGYGDDEFEWQDFNFRLGKLLETSKNGWIIKGYCERWNGKHNGGRVIFNKKELYDVIFSKGVDSVKVFEVNGHLFVNSYHHDGVNYFELKRLTKNGCGFWEKWEVGECGEGDLMEITEEECHQKIFNSNFMSGLPHFWKNIYNL
jgi:hypothetical protein